MTNQMPGPMSFSASFAGSYVRESKSNKGTVRKIAYCTQKAEKGRRDSVKSGKSCILRSAPCHFRSHLVDFIGVLYLF